MIYFDMEDANRIKRIANHHGLEKQLDKTVKECSELIIAIAKLKRGENIDVLGDIYGVANKISNVWILLNQLTELDDDLHEAVCDDIDFNLDKEIEKIIDENV